MQPSFYFFSFPRMLPPFLGGYIKTETGKAIASILIK
jgi:hypothetical protein